MYFKPEKSAMPFAAFLASVKRDESTFPAFPYAKAVCRCRYCLYFRRGKCTLKRCCCIGNTIGVQCVFRGGSAAPAAAGSFDIPRMFAITGLAFIDAPSPEKSSTPDECDFLILQGGRPQEYGRISRPTTQQNRKACRQGHVVPRLYCLSERVKAGACTFPELLQDCFANVKDCAFHFRLRLACERFAQQRSCFLGKGHRTRFLEGCALTRRKDPAFLAQLFLLSVSEQLWGKTKRVLTAGVVDYSGMDLNGFTGNDVLYFCAASDMRFGGSHIDLCDLSNDETVDFEAFRMICHAVALFLYGQDAVKIAERAQGRRKRRRGRAGRVRGRA